MNEDNPCNWACHLGLSCSVKVAAGYDATVFTYGQTGPRCLKAVGGDRERLALSFGCVEEEKRRETETSIRERERGTHEGDIFTRVPARANPKPSS